MFGSSTQVTVGSTLSRAFEQNQRVDVLAGGHWFGGQIAAVDGMGLALDGDDFTRTVIRLDSVEAVRVSVGSTSAGALGLGHTGSTSYGEIASL